MPLSPTHRATLKSTNINPKSFTAPDLFAILQALLTLLEQLFSGQPPAPSPAAKAVLEKYKINWPNLNWAKIIALIQAIIALLGQGPTPAPAASAKK